MSLLPSVFTLIVLLNAYCLSKAKDQICKKFGTLTDCFLKCENYVDFQFSRTKLNVVVVT